ncbi:threonine synthase [Chlorobaculum parvum NCIB 8327]|uniref:Threonine synthase n=1 Tax=Chlorobaculum parvum (strain DSM 263 / NCIMB 8327) TaxID=517417 RepID=B3QL65_CHLP8|nr:threonine synthase [Chlorobaculum parvum]ACF12303.1 threonine synthase [Chlorobaculum parvum NCIB 8327]
MIFYSTTKASAPVTMKKATLEGLAPDGGLYVPSEMPRFSAEEISLLESGSFTNIAFAIAKKFVGDEIPLDRLSALIDDCFTFETPLHELDADTFVEELFHGPTLAFKDYGARFLARMTGFYAAEESRMITVLVATSGDTGSAVAYGFHGIPNTRVVLLYPSGKVSHLQEQQLTTAGDNVHALEVKGDFDDCQRLVKQAFVDQSLRQKLTLTSANSINISRLIPQSFYYAWAALQLRQHQSNALPTFSVPSGNYGNLTAGVMAKMMGFPIGGFIAASNANDSVTRYLDEGRFEPRPTIKTLTTAMDVGNPSNFARLLHFYEGDFRKMGVDIAGIAVSDAETVETIRAVHDRYGYIMDPHTAVGYRALEHFRDTRSGAGKPAVVLSTAHPVKFDEAIRTATGKEVPIPESMHDIMNKPKQATLIGNRYEDLAGFLGNLDR